MKKKLLSVLLPLIIVIACTAAVWANVPSDAQPACDKCPKVNKAAAAPVDNSADVKTAPGCDNCAKMKAVEGKPCGAGDCDNCAKMKAAKAAPCAMKDCDNCPKMKAAEGASSNSIGCDKCAKMQKPTETKMPQTEKKPCCDKNKLQ